MKIDVFDENEITKFMLREEIKFQTLRQNLCHSERICKRWYECTQMVLVVSPPIDGETLMPSIIHDYGYQTHYTSNLKLCRSFVCWGTLRTIIVFLLYF